MREEGDDAEACFVSLVSLVSLVSAMRRDSQLGEGKVPVDPH
jgi:hypothetical protein